MDAPELRHRLVAILAADAVGYSRLMSVDDRRTVAALDAARLVFREEIDRAHGRVVDTAGDFVLAVFDAAGNAVAAALAIQRRLANDARDVPADDRMPFRIGVHLGDIIEKPDASIYGDGVNIAARLQALSEAGGIVVSQSVRTAVLGRVEAAFDDLGAVTVKNIAQPIQIFRLVERDAAGRRSWQRSACVLLASRRGSTIVVVAAAVALAISLPWALKSFAPIGDKVDAAESRTGALRPDSIAVLAFANLSGDASKEYFSDGVSEELSNTLELVPGLTVIARTSTLAFKTHPVPVPEVGKLLHVAYVVEGSVRAVSDRVRISARLTRATDGIAIWTESYDRALDDAIGVQTEIALVIAQKMRLHIDRARLSASRATNAEAQRLYFEAQRQIYEHTLAAYDRAETMLNQALTLDPNYLQAKVRLVNVRWNRLHGREELTYKNRNSAEILGLVGTIKAVLDAAPQLAEAHAELGVLYETNWQFAEADQAIGKAIELNPNLSNALLYQAKGFESQGRMGEAIAALQRSIDIDPISPVRKYLFAMLLGNAGFSDDALRQIDQAIVLNPGARGLLWQRALFLSRSGRAQEAYGLAIQLIETGNKNTLGDPAWEVMVRSGGRNGRNRVEEWLRGPGSEPQGTINPHLNRIGALLALGRAADALRDIEDETQFSVDDVVDLMYRTEWDPVSDTPRFRQILASLQMTEPYQQVRAWRDAHPPQRR